MGPISPLVTVRWLAVIVALGIFASFAPVDAAGPKGPVEAAPQTAFGQVEIESLETKGLFSSEPLMITGYVLEARSGGKSPGAVLAPACGGLMTTDGQFIRALYRQMARQLKQMGITSVLVDGFNPRGREEICSQNPRSRTIDTETRMKDSLAGLRYLRGRPDIDGDAIFLFTWGAAGGFLTMTRGMPESERIAAGFAAAVMLYPRCDRLDDPLDAYAPIQVFIGERDNWNPPGPCLTLAKTKHSGSAPMEVKVYEGAHHGFDLPRPPRERPNVNDAVGTVMVGGSPDAREDAYRRIALFLSGFMPKQPSGTAAAAVPGRGGAGTLTADEIRKTIIGNTVQFTAPASGRQLFVYYEKGGRVLMNAPTGNKVLTKKWTLTKENMLCRTFGRDNEQQCVRISRAAGANTFRLVNQKDGLDIPATLLEGRQLGK